MGVHCMATSTSDLDNCKLIIECLFRDNNLDDTLRIVTSQEPDVMEHFNRSTQFLILYFLGCNNKESEDLLTDTKKFEDFCLKSLTEDNIKKLQENINAKQEDLGSAENGAAIISNTLKTVTLAELFSIVKTIKKEQLSREAILYKLWEFVKHLACVIFWLVGAITLRDGVLNLASSIGGGLTLAYMWNLYRVGNAGSTAVFNAPIILGHISAAMTIVRDFWAMSQSNNRKEIEEAIGTIDQFEKKLQELHINPKIEIQSSNKIVRWLP
jgi:hypothetical protein